MNLWQAGLLWLVLRWISPARGEDSTGLPFKCMHPAYKPLLVSASPLVIYITSFLSTKERDHLRRLTKNKFSHMSDLMANNNITRTSQTAYMSRDAVLYCIEERVRAIQGYAVARSQMEPMQFVKYGPGEEHPFHTDWIVGDVDNDNGKTNADAGGNRVSTFFAYVHVFKNTTGGGTNFPLLDAPKGGRWCLDKLVNCDEPWENGLTFRPVAGNAIFWRNLDENGRGDDRTVHAGLPVSTGQKIGMNIWTRQGDLSADARGPEFYPV